MALMGSPWVVCGRVRRQPQDANIVRYGGNACRG